MKRRIDGFLLRRLQKDGVRHNFDVPNFYNGGVMQELRTGMKIALHWTVSDDLNR